MKIKSLHISAFGKLKNKDINFEESFNIIYGGNEQGKTTVMNFIKMMFYGTERSSAQLNKNLRKKYTPWDNSLMAGSIDFENKGRLYRLERIFGNSNSTDKVTLIDLGFGTTETVSADIGSKLFGLSAAAFERSIFIGQFGFPESNNLASGELNGKLSNIALTGDEAISFDEVNARIENAKYELMSKSGRSGIYDKNVKLCESLEKELEDSLQKQELVENAKQKAQQLADEIKDVQEKALTLKTKIDSENDLRNAKKLEELLALKAQLDELNNELVLSDGSLADEMFVRKVEFCISKTEKINDKILSKQNENAILQNNLNLALNPSTDATPEKLKELSKSVEAKEKEKNDISLELTELKNLKKAKINYVWFILAAIFLLVGIPLLISNLSKIFAFVGLGLSVAFIFIGIISAIKAKEKNTKIQEKIVDLQLKETRLISLLASEKSNLTAISTALNSNAAMIESQKEKLNANNEEIKTLTQEKQHEASTLHTLFSSFKSTQNIDEIKLSLEKLKKHAEAQKEIKQNINYILKDVGNISYDEAKAKLSNLNTDTQIDFDAIKAEYEQLLQQITDRKTEVTAIITETKSILQGIKNLDEIKTELDTLKQKTASQKDYCNCLDIAINVLTDSYAEVRQSYGSALEKRASEIFKGLTGGNYSNMSISKSFDISVEKNDIFGIKELDYLSSGTVDQAYLSLRLALSELLSEENIGLPIILDDSLAQYDDNRTEAALTFLKDYAKIGQIIMFTCHKSVIDTAKKLDANPITL